MKASKDFSDGHLWYSVISRPPSSAFTRVQRVSCCFSLLLCTMLTSIMFYGIPSDPSEQTMDLGTALIPYIVFFLTRRSSILEIFEPFLRIRAKQLNSVCKACRELCLMNSNSRLLIFRRQTKPASLLFFFRPF